MAVSLHEHFNLPNPAEVSLCRTERINVMNRNKIRIRHFLEVTKENILKRVLLVFDTALEDKLDPSHILSCEIVDSWCGYPKCKDIVVTFDSTKVRERVYNALVIEELEIQDVLGRYVQFDDELGKERLRVWKQAVYDFCSSYVFISNGAILIELNFKIYSIRTLKQYRQFVRSHLFSLDTIKEECEKTEIRKK